MVIVICYVCVSLLLCGIEIGLDFSWPKVILKMVQHTPAGKEVQLLSRVSHKHFNHEKEQAFEWNVMVSSANALFDGPVVAFSFR
jgi:hypothetical protein